MNDKNFDQEIEEIKNLRMTAAEKRAIFERILPESEPAIKVFWIYSHAYYAIASLLIVVLAGVGLTFAAEGSLPGDILYPVKVALTEPVRDVLATNSGSEAKWQVAKAERRLEEAETLATAGRLDSEKEKKLETLLDKHTEKLSIALDDLENIDEADDVKKDEIKNNQNKNRADEVRSNFQERMNKHAQTLEGKGATTSAERTVGSNLAKTARENAKAIEKQVRKEGRGNSR